eukprot:508133-Rhodomonas_salina.1
MVLLPGVVRVLLRSILDVDPTVRRVAAKGIGEVLAALCSYGLATECPVLTTECPVLTQRMLPGQQAYGHGDARAERYQIGEWLLSMLREGTSGESEPPHPYAMSGTEIAYAATRSGAAMALAVSAICLRVSCAMSAICLRGSFAMRGTEIAYGSRLLAPGPLRRTASPPYGRSRFLSAYALPTRSPLVVKAATGGTPLEDEESRSRARGYPRRQCRVLISPTLLMTPDTPRVMLHATKTEYSAVSGHFGV